MKKLIIYLILLLVVTVNDIPVYAKQKHQHDSKGMEQVMDHFMLQQFNDEIAQAVKGYYQNDSIRIQYNWWDKNYDVVEIDQFEKGNKLSHPFIVKFTVLTYGEKGHLGTDTITFGATPSHLNKEFNEKNLATVKVDFIKYSHREPKGKQ